MKDEMILCECGAFNPSTRISCLSCEGDLSGEHVVGYMYSAINPKHYRSHPSGVEVIEIAEHLNFCLGNAIKYILRCELKGKPIEDLEKAKWYLEREIERRKKG